MYEAMREVRIKMPSKIKMLEREVDQRDRFKLESWELVKSK
jgi:hypothetical protein